MDQNEARSTQDATIRSEAIRNQNKCKPKRKRMKQRSIGWDHFVKYTDKDGSTRARCKYCPNKTFACDSTNNGTSNLLRNYKACTMNPDNVMRQTVLKLQSNTTNGHDGEGTLTCWRYDQDAIRTSLAHMLIIDELSFRFIEKEGFRYFMSVTCPKFQLPSRITIARDVYQVYLNERKKLRKWFASTGQRVSLTTDTWTSLQRVNYIHKGSQIGELIEKCLLDWGIDKLALKLRRAFVRFESVDPQFKFELQPVGVPEEEDWKKVDIFVTFFKTFYDLTQRISGSRYVTSNTLFHEIIDVDSLLKKWIESTNSDFASMAKKMKVKYDKYWGDIGKTNMLIYVSVVLDPRHKLRYLDFVFFELQGHGDGSEIVMSKNIKDATYELFCSYQKNSITSMSNENTQRMSKEDVQETVITDMKERYKKFKSLSGGVEEKSELEKYLTEENMADSKGFCILMWWKINSNRFPVLSQMARDILAVPVSTSHRSLNVEDETQENEELDEELANLTGDLSILDL
ncbi:hypothetical protein LXL04_038700 [Taraxacum kok-saghyz]